MSREYNKTERLLDAWSPPSSAGDPVGFIATTFTFDSGFFEEDCLSAFLQMESDPDSEALAYILEREEKLSKVSCAMVLVDQHNARSNRNVRWDLLPVRISPGIQHAKISLLCWTNLTRIIIASANLTPDGYRRNQEIFGVVDFHDEAEAPIEVLSGTLDFIEQLMREGVRGSSEIIARGITLINRNRNLLDTWQLTNSNQGASGLYPIFVSPGRGSLLQQSERLWFENFKFSPYKTEIVSPFFDQEYHERGPLFQTKDSKFWNTETKEIYCSGEQESVGSDKIRLHAPQYLCDESGKSINFKLIPEVAEPDKVNRPVHLKCIRLSRRNHVALILGSSNFTSSGMGTIPSCNYEANLMYLAKANVDPDRHKILEKCLPDAISVGVKNISFEPPVAEDDDSLTPEPTLPKFIMGAEADMDDHKVVITFEFDRTAAPEHFNIQTLDGITMLSSEDVTTSDQSSIVIIWFDPHQTGAKHRVLPSGFDVELEGIDKKAWLPLNVRNYDCLPPPDQLRDLPLHVLLQILTSARPINQILKRFFRELTNEDDREAETDPMIDPHRRVDTSGFILQRTRRISYAFNAIRENLSKPCGTAQSLHWKLYGPVGLLALVNAIVSDEESNQFKIPEERLFFLAELILELSKIKPARAKNCLPPEDVRSEFDLFIDYLVQVIKKVPAYKESWLKDYLKRILEYSRTTNVA